MKGARAPAPHELRHLEQSPIKGLLLFGGPGVGNNLFAGLPRVQIREDPSLIPFASYELSDVSRQTR